MAVVTQLRLAALSTRYWVGPNTTFSVKVDVVKLILAIIQPTKLKAVQEALAKIEVERLTVFDAHGYARQRGHVEMFRGAEYQSNLLRKISLEIAVNDDFLDRTIDAIVSVSRSGPEGNVGDGKIFVLPLEECFQIGGEARGPSAI